MAKKTVKTVGVTPVTTVNVAVASPMYSLGKLPRHGLNEGTKHGQGGTKGTYAALAEALKAGPMDLAAIKALCKAQGDAGFARYAVRNHWLLPA